MFGRLFAGAALAQEGRRAFIRLSTVSARQTMPDEGVRARVIKRPPLLNSRGSERSQCRGSAVLGDNQATLLRSSSATSAQ